MIAVPFMLGIIAIAEIFVPWYFGEGYGPVKYLMCATTPILLAIGLSNVTGIQYLIQVGEQKIYTFSVVVGAIINMIFNFILIKTIGTIGAVLSTVLAEYSILFIQLYFVHKDISVKNFFSPSFKYLVSGAVMFGLVFAVSRRMVVSTVSIGIMILVGVVSYIGMLLILKDQFFFGVLKQIFRK